MTIIVLGLDALDAGLVEKWDIESLMLNQHREIETFDYSKDQPYTLEVWPSIATGVGPEKHGVDGETASEWSTVISPLFNLGSKILPDWLRMKIGSNMEKVGFEYSLPEVEHETFMDGERRAVHNWPCVENPEVLDEMWDIFSRDIQDKKELNRLVFGKSGEQFGWIKEMLNYDLELIATHNHSLDILGHCYSTPKKSTSGDMEDLRKAYEKTGNFVKEIKNNMSSEDELIIISDHGMTNSMFDDEPGNHSYRAFASTTIDESLPNSVFGYREWIEKNCPEINKERENDISMPTEKLKSLGYI